MINYPHTSDVTSGVLLWLQVRVLLEADRGELVAQTNAVLSALDAGIARMDRFQVCSQ